jgi:hypothetical protein
LILTVGVRLGRRVHVDCRAAAADSAQRTREQVLRNHGEHRQYNEDGDEVDSSRSRTIAGRVDSLDVCSR